MWQQFKEWFGGLPLWGRALTVVVGLSVVFGPFIDDETATPQDVASAPSATIESPTSTVSSSSSEPTLSTVVTTTTTTVAWPPELADGTWEVELLDCWQEVSTDSTGDIDRLPHVLVRVTNLGVDRMFSVDAWLDLESSEYPKATSFRAFDLKAGEVWEGTLRPDFRHQASYTEDGLVSCRLTLLTFGVGGVSAAFNDLVREVPLDLEMAAGPERSSD